MREIYKSDPASSQSQSFVAHLPDACEHESAFLSIKLFMQIDGEMGNRCRVMMPHNLRVICDTDQHVALERCARA